jgi:hypothetical protein
LNHKRRHSKRGKNQQKRRQNQTLSSHRVHVTCR